MPILEINGKRVEFATMPTEEDIDEVASSIQSQEQKQSLGDSVEKTLQTTGELFGEAGKRTVQEGPTSFNTITGGPAVALQSNLKAVALEKAGVPPEIAQSIAIATDPQALLGGLEIAGLKSFGKIFGKKAKSVLTTPKTESGALQRLQAMKAKEKGTQLSAELFPSVDRSTSLKRGETPDVDIAVFEGLKDTKNLKQLGPRFKRQANQTLEELNEIIAKKNRRIGATQEEGAAIIKELISSDSELARLYQQSSPKIRAKIDQLVQDEIDFMKESGVINLKNVHDRKTHLNIESRAIQEKASKGIATVDKPLKRQVQKASANAYRKIADDIDPEIRAKNKRLHGQMEAEEASGKIAEKTLEKEDVAIGAAAQTAGRPSLESGVAGAIRVALPMLRRDPKALIKRILKQKEIFDKKMAESRAKQAPRVKPKRPRGTEDVSVVGETPPQQITGATVGQNKLAAPTGRIEQAKRPLVTGPEPRRQVTGPPPQKQLPPGQEFEIVSPAESAGRLRQQAIVRPESPGVRSRTRLGTKEARIKAEEAEITGKSRGFVDKRSNPGRRQEILRELAEEKPKPKKRTRRGRRRGR